MSSLVSSRDMSRWSSLGGGVSLRDGFGREGEALGARRGVTPMTTAHGLHGHLRSGNQDRFQQSAARSMTLIDRRAKTP